MKLIIPFIFGLVLTACGGGGSSHDSFSESSSTYIKTIKSDYSMYVSIVPGKFKNDGNSYVLVAGNHLDMGGVAPVNIFRLSSNGGGVDVTYEILGSNNIYASSNNPLVADFNNDGIDDIFLPGFVDIANQYTATQVFLSRPGTNHSRQYLDYTWSHGASAADLNNDGNIDVVDSEGKIWINDGRGNFTLKDHSWSNGTLWMHGMGTCVGDFLNNGNKQIVITDLNIDSFTWPINDTAIFELDNNLKPVNRHLLPAPIYDIGNADVREKSHDVRCVVADMNNDGLHDLVVFSRPWAYVRNGWIQEGQIQILINKGNFNFIDQTNLVGFDSNVDIDYTPVITDFNGDGVLDIWSTSQLLTGKNNQWIRKKYNQIPNYPVSTPVKVNGKWGIVYKKQTDYNKFEIHFTKPELTIDL